MKLFKLLYIRLILNIISHTNLVHILMKSITKDFQGRVIVPVHCATDNENKRAHMITINSQQV